MKVTVKEVVSYKGHSVQKNGNLNISFSAMYSEITNSMQLLQLLNNDVKILAKLPGEKAISLGTFGVKSILFGGDGTSVLKFTSLCDFVELENINAIVSQENFQVKFEGDIEAENEEEEKEGE